MVRHGGAGAHPQQLAWSSLDGEFAGWRSCGLTALFYTDWKPQQPVSPWSLEEFGPDIRECCWSPWWCSNWVRPQHVHFTTIIQMLNTLQSHCTFMTRIQTVYKITILKKKKKKNHNPIHKWSCNAGVKYLHYVCTCMTMQWYLMTIL